MNSESSSSRWMWRAVISTMGSGYRGAVPSPSPPPPEDDDDDDDDDDGDDEDVGFDIEVDEFEKCESTHMFPSNDLK